MCNERCYTAAVTLKVTKMCEVVFLLLVCKPIMDRTVEGNRGDR